MFTPRAWSQLEAHYRVPGPPMPLRPIKIAVIGGAWGRLRNVLQAGSDGYGLILLLTGFLSAPRTIHVPWAHIQRTKTPMVPLFLTPVESFLVGPQYVLLTLPAGLVPTRG